MEATCSSETSVDLQRTTWRYIPEDMSSEFKKKLKAKNWKHEEYHLLGYDAPTTVNMLRPEFNEKTYCSSPEANKIKSACFNIEVLMGFG
jgi:hypothetical protein